MRQEIRKASEEYEAGNVDEEELKEVVVEGEAVEEVVKEVVMEFVDAAL